MLFLPLREIEKINSKGAIMKKYTQETMKAILAASDKARRAGIQVQLNLNMADLKGVNLENANLKNSDFESANLENADLRCANLQNADLRCANLKGANLKGADLRCAILQNADLRWVNLKGADLRCTNLKGANLEGANLDFSCLPLWCGSLSVVWDERLIFQVAYHLADMLKSTGMEVPESIKDMANQSHVIKKHDKDEF